MSTKLKIYILERILIVWTLIDGIVKIAITATMAYLLVKAINHIRKKLRNGNKK